MERRRLGKTELEVSIMGFGSSPLGNVYGEILPGDVPGLIDAAIDCGINFFDTSPYYGQTLAEERLGAALAGKRNKVILATKCGRYGLDEFDFSRARIRDSVEKSLDRLQTDYVDLLQAHDIEFGHEQQIIEETIPALRELQTEGKTRYVGITGYPVRMLRRVAEAVPVDTILSYCHYSLLNTEMQEVLAPLSEQVGLISASPLMMGLLTEAGAPPWHVAPDDLKAAARRSVRQARANGLQIEKLALQFALQQEFAASTVIGMSSADEIKQNVMAIAEDVDPKGIRDVRAAIGNGFASTWPSGLAENSR